MKRKFILGFMALVLFTSNVPAAVSENTNDINSAKIESHNSHNETEEILDNFLYYYTAVSAADNYVDILKSGTYKSPYTEYSIDSGLYNSIILANLAKNMDSYVNEYSPDTLYSQDFKAAVQNLFYTANVYYVNTARGAKAEGLEEAVDKYISAKTNYMSLLDTKLNLYITGINNESKELSDYKAAINSILNNSYISDIDYTNDQDFYNAIDKYTSNLRVKISAVSTDNTTKHYEDVLLSFLNEIDKSSSKIQSFTSYGGIQKFYGKNNLASSLNAFYSKIAESFYGNNTSTMFKNI